MSRGYSRFIPVEDVGSVTAWNFGAVAHMSEEYIAKLEADTKAKAQAQALESEQVRSVSLRQEGYDEGYQLGHDSGYSTGYAEGFVQGQAKATLEGQRQLQDYVDNAGFEAGRAFGTIFESAQAQIAAQEELMARGVLDLACELARQVLRRELATSPDAVLPVVCEALGQLSVDCKAAVVRLHPQDQGVLHDELRKQFASLALSVVADNTLSRGGCLVQAAGAVVDGTLEKRWMRAVASLGLESAWEVSDGDGT